MIRKVVLAMAVFGIFSVAIMSDGILGYSARGAEWYPFYGYQRPNYLDAPCVASVQPATPQASTCCAPTQSTVVPARCMDHQQCKSARWYPFYGYHRPSYLDR